MEAALSQFLSPPDRESVTVVNSIVKKENWMKRQQNMGIGRSIPKNTNEHF